MSDIVSEIERLGQKYSMSHWGHSQLEKPQSLEFYRTWLDRDYHGEMKYLEEHFEMKAEPKKYWDLAESAIVFAKSYLPFPNSEQKPALSAARTALYSQGLDYHHWFKQELSSIGKELQSTFPNLEFLPLTDSSPVLERDLAAKAGLGWFGKNTCLIHPKKGSLFFIGEIYTNLQMPQSREAFPDFCGTCTRCLEICPTGALEAPHLLDARKCISYWTIESKEVPPIHLREKIGDMFFGCDLCQTICPWNQKLFKAQLNTESIRSSYDQTMLVQELHEILTASGKQLQKKFLGSPLARAGTFGLKRNAIVVATNLRLRQLLEPIQKCQDHPKLTELVNWSLQKLNQVPVS